MIILFLGLIIATAAVIAYMIKMSEQGSNGQKEIVNENLPKSDYSRSYQKKYLLTKNEYQEYKKLKAYADQHKLQICPKIRLLDLIEPRKGDGYMSALGKIQSKHVDFVICDQNLYIKGIIELDDNSHNKPERQERDKFVNEVLTSVGYKVIHTFCITEETLNPFIEKTEEKNEP